MAENIQSPLSRVTSRSALPRTESLERMSLPRNRSMKALLPMNDESAFTTRGQHLPFMLSQLGSSVRERVSVSRRGSFFVGPDERDLEVAENPTFERIRTREGTPGRPSLLSAMSVDGNIWSNGYHQGDLRDAESRRPSEALALLNAPQIRTMRLIGNSNPRYQWYVNTTVWLVFSQKTGNGIGKVMKSSRV
jgi:hypothetical protein